MELNEYQTRAAATAVYPASTITRSISYCVIALSGEAGEIANAWKKIIRADRVPTQEDIDHLREELGDVLWYVAALASELGASLDEIATGNLEKLAQRKAEGKLIG